MHIYKIVYIKTFKIAPTCFEPKIIFRELHCSWLKLHKKKRAASNLTVCSYETDVITSLGFNEVALLRQPPSCFVSHPVTMVTWRQPVIHHYVSLANQLPARLGNGCDVIQLLCGIHLNEILDVNTSKTQSVKTVYHSMNPILIPKEVLLPYWARWGL